LNYENFYRTKTLILASRNVGVESDESVMKVFVKVIVNNGCSCGSNLSLINEND